MTRIGKSNPLVRDARIIASLTAIVVIVAYLIDAFEVVASWARHHEEWQAGGLLTAILALAFALAVFAWPRSVELPCGLDECRRAEEALREGE